MRVAYSQYESRGIHGHVAETPDVDMGAYLDSLVNAVGKGIAREIESYRLSSLELGLLRACMERRGRTASQLAEVLPVDASRVSRVVNGLVERGLLRRNRPRRDRRVVLLTLTVRGKELTAEATRRVQDYYARLMEGVSEEEARTSLAVVSKVLANHAALVQAEQDAGETEGRSLVASQNRGGGGGESTGLFPMSEKVETGAPSPR